MVLFHDATGVIRLSLVVFLVTVALRQVSADCYVCRDEHHTPAHEKDYKNCFAFEPPKVSPGKYAEVTTSCPNDDCYIFIQYEIRVATEIVKGCLPHEDFKFLKDATGNQAKEGAGCFEVMNKGRYNDALLQGVGKLPQNLEDKMYVAFCWCNGDLCNGVLTPEQRKVLEAYTHPVPEQPNETNTVYGRGGARVMTRGVLGVCLILAGATWAVVGRGPYNLF